MGIEKIEGSNWVNYFIYGCFIFIMPIMFFNILTAISLDAIGDMIKNASDNIVYNKIEYFERMEIYNSGYKVEKLRKIPFLLKMQPAKDVTEPYI